MCNTPEMEIIMCPECGQDYFAAPTLIKRIEAGKTKNICPDCDWGHYREAIFPKEETDE